MLRIEIKGCFFAQSGKVHNHIPANYSFMKGVTPFFENSDDVLLITKVNIFVDLIARKPF